MTADPVPAISETDATGATADLYADIRSTLGVGVVNLIWRHLATMPGGLEWAWSATRPLYTSGAAEAEAARLLADLDFPELPKISNTALADINIDGGSKETILAVLDSYNRSNALNLMALSAFVAEQEAVEPSPPTPAALGQVARAIPGLPPLDGLAPDVRDLVLKLNGLGSREADPIVASMYRHLSYWPGYLTLAWNLLSPVQEDGRLAMAIETTQSLSRSRAGGLAASLAKVTSPDAETAEAVRTSVNRFADHAISRMVPIACMLRRAME